MPPKSDTDVRTWARRYIERGFTVSPLHGVRPDGTCRCGLPLCDSPGKHHVDNDTTVKAGHVFVPDEFAPDDNIAIWMGKSVVDPPFWLLGVDFDECGPADFNLDLPPTLTATTGKGTHMVYKVTPDAPWGNWIDVFDSRSKDDPSRYRGGVDTRYIGGRLVCEPSRNARGPYRWLDWDAEVVFLHERDLLSRVNWHRRKRGLPIKKCWSEGRKLK